MNKEIGLLQREYKEKMKNLRQDMQEAYLESITLMRQKCDHKPTTEVRTYVGTTYILCSVCSKILSEQMSEPFL